MGSFSHHKNYKTVKKYIWYNCLQALDNKKYGSVILEKTETQDVNVELTSPFWLRVLLGSWRRPSRVCQSHCTEDIRVCSSWSPWNRIWNNQYSLGIKIKLEDSYYPILRISIKLPKSIHKERQIMKQNIT